MEATEKRPTTIAAQPGLSICRHMFRTEGVGKFNQDDGQPIFLMGSPYSSYPPVVRPKEPLREDPDQAYQGQDLVDPAVIRPRHTCLERVQWQEEAERKRQAERGLPISLGVAGATERAWYKGSQVIESQPRPWERDFTHSTDCAMLAMYNHQLVAAADESQLILKQGPTPALVTPSYLIITTPIGDAVLPAQEVWRSAQPSRMREEDVRNQSERG